MNYFPIYVSFQTETPVEDISFQTIRDVFNSNDTAQARSSEQRRLVEDFRTKPFEELKSRVNEKQRQADQRIGQLLNVLYLTKDTLPITTTVTTANGNIPTTSNGTSKLQKNNFIYPELFTY